MVDPVTLVIIGSKIVSSIFGAKKNKAKKKARKAGANIEKVRNLQAKRAFLRNYRQAQAAALVGGVASGVSVDSSAVKGTQASQQTQAQFGSFEQDVLGSYARAAGKHLDRAGRFQAFASAAALVGDIAGSGIFPTGGTPSNIGEAGTVGPANVGIPAGGN